MGGLSLVAQATVIQTNYSTVNGNLPGPGGAVSTTDLLQTSLASATRTGGPGSGGRYFYEEDSGFTEVDLGRLSDGLFGTPGYSANDVVLPNQVSLTFGFDLSANPGGYTINSVATYASWDSGRDGQAYSLEYSLASAPTIFLPLVTLTPFNIPLESFPLVFSDPFFGDFYDQSAGNTLVVLSDGSGPLMEGVASLRFVFGDFANNVDAFENGGTGYREFDVVGAATVPEPGSALLATLGGLALLYRRRA
jgi:hypothetical protein